MHGRRVMLGKIIRISGFATILYTSFWISLCVLRWDEFYQLPINSLGDWLAGISAPPAFLWLVLGFFQQGEELQNSVGALRLQTVALERSVSEQAEISETQIEQLRTLQEQLRDSKNHSSYAAYLRYSEQMTHIRTLEIQSDEISEIWKSGDEAHAIREIGHRHFYFAKMLLQANEGYFLALQDPSFETEKKGFEMRGWEENFKTDLTAPKFREIWSIDIVRESYHPAFQNKVDQLIKEVLLKLGS